MEIHYTAMVTMLCIVAVYSIAEGFKYKVNLS